MNSVTFFKALDPRAIAVTSALFAVGCGGDPEIKTYKVAKEDNHSQAAQAHASAATPGPMAERPAIPHLHAETPAGWQEVPPERMRVAAFRIAGEAGKSAEVAVIPLPGVNNMNLRIVNMWREELGQGEFTPEEFQGQSQKVQIGDTEGVMFELTGTRSTDSSSVPTGSLGAIAERGKITWSVKMIGDKDLVAQQKNNFIAYLKSLEFHEGSHAHGGTRETIQVAQAPNAENPVSSNTEKLPPGTEKPNFKAPENWKTKPPGPMITSAYSVQSGEAQAEVTISKFPGPVGGMAANIQRWRGQLGLPQATEEELKNTTQMLEIGGKKEAYMVDLKGTNARTGKAARMIAIGVPFQADTWFFKFMGDEAAVEKEKENFLKFVKEAY